VENSGKFHFAKFVSTLFYCSVTEAHVNNLRSHNVKVERPGC